MCKIAVIPGLTDDKTELAWKFIRKLAKEMSGYTDDDGFGYAALDGEGNLFGERWFNPKEAFSNRDEKVVISQHLVKKFKGMIKGKETVYNSFGKVHDKSLRSIMLHARNATTEKSLINTHPFVSEGTALIHNGVIDNHEELIKKISTCDSEVILNEYLKAKVMDNVKDIQKIVSRLDGYYACGVMSKNRQGKYILDVFKESTARLRGYYVKELGTMVFATPGQSDEWGPVNNVCKELNLTLVDTYELENDRIVRMDAMTGEVLDCIDFDATFKDSTVAKKKGNKGGNGGGSNHTHHRNINDVQTNFRQIFTAGDKGRSQRSLAERQKDEELERELIEGVGYTKSYEGSGMNDTPPVLPEGASTKFNAGDDWQEDDNGVWRRKYTSEAV